MRFPIRYFKAKTSINFMRWRWVWFSISIVSITCIVLLLLTKGLNYGIDFTGGILMEVRTEKEMSLAPFRKALEKENFGEVALQNFGERRNILIRIQTKANTDQAKTVERAKDIVKQVASESVEFRKIDYVGPTVGKELLKSGILASGLALGAIMVYLWFRFEWQYGLGGLLALIHDAIFVIGFYAVSGFDFGLTAVAAILTIIGYSINDSVVIYDRIRENMRKYKQMGLSELINLSINETLSRTILTATTTLLAAIVLLVFGGDVIRGFSAALVFGIAIGTYSSIYISAPILIYFGRAQLLRQETVKAAG
ncbi:MAG: protein translocase subunit SecF [Rickettsiales bacterium]